MKTYIGSKLVKAAPMSKAKFMEAKGKEGGFQDEDGFLVEYPDGYQSWNTMDEFHRISRVITDDEYRSFFGIEPDGNLDKDDFQWYIQAKVVNAEPMDRKYHYKNHIQGENDEDMPESATEEGYKVIYPNGYESWSPAVKFEEAYREISRLEHKLYMDAISQGETRG